MEELSLPLLCLEAGLDICFRMICFTSNRNPDAQGIEKEVFQDLQDQALCTGKPVSLELPNKAAHL